MNNLSFYRVLGVGAAALAATGGLMGTAVAAHATPAPVDLTIVGSNTTQEVMGAITTKFNKSSVATKDNITATNVDAQPADPGTVAPSDANCNGGTAITYISESPTEPNQRTAPNGSGAGRTALATSVSNPDSCVSIARSSSPGASTDPAGTEAYAYAVDSVSWVGLGTGGDQPANLSMTQLEGIYDCTITNWNQVGGKNGVIQRYYPQEGSGSGSFFAGVLGFDPRTLGGVNQCATGPTQIEENEAAQITTDKKDAIMIFSAGAWISQANGVDTDMRNGFTMRTINGSKNKPVQKEDGKWRVGPITTEANVEPADYNPTSDTAVQGVRNLFNFINTNSIDYSAAAKMVGAGSALCTGQDTSIIATYGFKGLGKCVEQF